MNYIEFDREKLVNINYAKSREILRCSRTGSFATTTLSGLNTRKYHGVFIVPQKQFNGERYVLVSNLNETLIINDMEFHLGIHQFKGGAIDPKGNKYLQRLVLDPIPTLHCTVGKFNFTKEILFLKESDRVIVRYIIEDDFDSATFQFQPLLAFRQIHQLTHENSAVNTSFSKIKNGVSYCLYDGFTPIYLQSSQSVVYEHEPTWFHDIEYEEDIKRGYDGHEDLINLGRIFVPVNEKELFFTIGLEEISPSTIKALFEKELAERTSRSTFFNCLQNAAEQFIVKRDGKTEIIAGYPWFGRWGRDTFISLPGLTLALNNPELCKTILDDMLSEMKDGLFPNIGQGDAVAYNSVDAPLWFFRALQQYTAFTKSEKKIWKEYGETMKSILSAYKNGSLFNIKMLDNGLIYAGGEGLALTWMDAIVDGKPVTPRTGLAVEINGLWYNALCFAIEMARLGKDKKFVEEWEEITRDFPAVFKETFWSKEIGYLADYVNGDYKNFQVRPNMMIAVSLPYSPISVKIRQLVLKKVWEELLTDKGIRTLSPSDPQYKGHYGGTQAERDLAYHQGTVWVWLLAPFADGLIAVYGKDAFPVLEKILFNFDSCLMEYGISTVAEIYDGDPPHKANGCISQAWSVAALLYIKWLLETKRK
ncbi:MAG TPA: amylo-alpha-1,6-glucosidase [Bacteroidales bacterium]|jgi:predicted glycogen debranching enzyme|nr:amylo-alpha-1,6-glucosidase [Bacteroidales bacterium]